MKKQLLIFLVFPLLSFGQTQIGEDIDGESQLDRFGESVSLSSDGTIIAIGAPRNDGNGQTSGHVRVFENQGGNWIQIGQDINGAAIDDLSGQSISLSSDGTILAIGAPGEFGEPIFGSIRIYEYQNSNWIQIGQTINGESDSSSIGSRLDLSNDGNILAIGGENSNVGFVRIFENQGNNWVQIGNDIIGEEGDNFSSDLSFSSDASVLVIGADFYGNNDSGGVFVFENQNGNWVQIGETIIGDGPIDFFGALVDISSDGSIIAASGPGAGDVGIGYTRVFENQGNNWVQIGNDIVGEAVGDNLGVGLNLSSDGSIIAIGTIGNDDNGDFSGKATVYKNLSDNWVQVGDEILGEMTGDGFGRKISLSSSGEIIAISSTGHDTNRGHVRVFDLSGPLSTEEITQSQFTIYPNPASTNVTIQLDQNSSLEKAIIYNNLGQFVKEVTTPSIDISNLSRGLYFIEVITNQGKASRKLIIE